VSCLELCLLLTTFTLLLERIAGLLLTIFLERIAGLLLTIFILSQIALETQIAILFLKVSCLELCLLLTTFTFTQITIFAIPRREMFMKRIAEHGAMAENEGT
jgi:hypothetical protein